MMMATATASSTTNSSPPRTSAPLPRRTLNPANPIPLSASQEAEIRKLYYKNVRGYCADEIREFAHCARSRTFTATWVCRDQRLAMNGCMLSHAKPEEEDRAREEWIAGKEERRQKRLDEVMGVESRRKEIIDMMERDKRKVEQEQELLRRRKQGEMG